MAQRTQSAQSSIRKVRERKPRVSKVTNARAALDDFGRGMETYCLTFGQFSLMDAVEAILKKTGPADVALSTWTAGAADLSRSAEHLHDGRIRSLRMVVDCSFGQRQPGYLAQVRELFGDDAIRSTRTHAKFVVITNDEWSVAVRTSMNLNENPRLESIEVSDDPALAGFLLRVVDEIFVEESAGDFRTKSRPNLPGIDGVTPTSSVSMSRGGVRVSAPNPPSHLSKDAARVWVEVASKHDDPSRVECPELEAYCVQVARMRDAQSRIDREGLVIADEKGRPVPHPAIAIEKAAQVEVRAWGSKFAPPRRRG